MDLSSLVSGIKRKCGVAAAGLLAFASASAISAQAIFSEDFESYETIEDVFAAGWTLDGNGPEYELRSGSGGGAQGSNKWVASTAKDISSRLIRVLPQPISSAGQNNFHFYTRATNWEKSQTGVALRDASGDRTLGIGTRSSASVGMRNYWAIELRGVRNERSTLLDMAPPRDINVWTKLEMHQTEAYTVVEINDVAIPRHFGSVVTKTNPYTLIYIGNGIHKYAVEYDNIYVWSGPDTSVVDWDLYE